MSLSWSEVSQWRAEPLNSAYYEANRVSGLLVQAEADLPATVPKTWAGTAAQEASSVATRLRRQLEGHVDAAETIKKGLRDAADAMDGVVKAVTSAKDFATENSLTIADDGTVTDALPSAEFETQQLADEYTEERQELVLEAVSLIERALKRAKNVDDGLIESVNLVMTSSEQYGTLTKLIKWWTQGKATVPLTQYLTATSDAVPNYTKFLQTLSRYDKLMSGPVNLSDPKALKELAALEKSLGKMSRGGKALPLATQQAAIDSKQAYRLFKTIRGYAGDANAMKTALAAHPAATEAEVLAQFGRFDNLATKFRPVTTVATKVSGPASVVLGTVDVVSAVRDSESDTDDRVARGIGGTASVVGGAAATALAFGVGTTVGAPLLATAAVGGGVIAVGAYSYEHREEIGNAVSSAWDATGGAAGWVGEKSGSALSATGDKLSGGLNRLKEKF